MRLDIASPPVATEASSSASTTPSRPQSVGALIDLYLQHWRGRDGALPYRLSEWSTHLGAAALATLTDDDVFHALRAIAAAPARVYAGRDVEGHPIHKLKGRGRRSDGTLNRYHAALSGVFTWAIRERLAPKGWDNPCRKVPRRRECPGVVRFLSDRERTALLAACQAASWPRLYVLVVMAITTGARKGELLGLRWRDVELVRSEASVSVTKNGDARVLPLTAAVVAELTHLLAEDRRRFAATWSDTLVFHSGRRPEVAYSFEPLWHAALAAAKVQRFRFHDLRHTCASYLAQQGASLLEIAEVMGHRQLAMVKRYVHLATGHKKTLVNRVLGDIR
jgi:integrase